MVSKKAGKELEKPVFAKAAEPKKGLPLLPIIGGVVLVLLIVGFLWLNSMNSLGDVDTGVPKVGIDVLQAPISAKVGDTIQVSWRLVGTTADSSEVMLSAIPMGGFGSDFDVSTLTVEASGYPEKSAGTLGSSDFGGQAFTTRITVNYLPLFMRIHALSGTTNYWTNEMVVVEQ